MSRAPPDVPSVLITGSTGGLGLALVERYLSGGFQVFAGMRAPLERDGVWEGWREEHGPRLRPVALDLTRAEDLSALSAVLPEAGLDVLIHNAGWGCLGPLELLSPADIRAQLEVNLIAPLLLTRTLLPALRARGGVVVFVSSVMAHVPWPMSAVYASSKAGLSQAAGCLEHELRPHGVRVILLEPGRHRSGFDRALRWPVAKGSVYHQQQSDYRSWRRLLSRRGATSAASFAERTFRSSQSRSPFLSTQGWDAWLTRSLLRPLPARLAHLLWSWLFRWAHGRGRRAS